MRPLRKCMLNNLKELFICMKLFIIDKNRILDFTPLRELHAPALEFIWTTTQSFSFSYLEIAFAVINQLHGFCFFSHKSWKRLVYLSILRHKTRQRKNLRLWRSGVNGQDKIPSSSDELSDDGWHSCKAGVMTIWFTFLYIKSILI